MSGELWVAGPGPHSSLSDHRPWLLRAVLSQTPAQPPPEVTPLPPCTPASLRLSHLAVLPEVSPAELSQGTIHPAGC